MSDINLIIPSDSSVVDLSISTSTNVVNTIVESFNDVQFTGVHCGVFHLFSPRLSVRQQFIASWLFDQRTAALWPMDDKDMGRYPVEAQRDHLLADHFVGAVASYPRSVDRVVNAVDVDRYVRRVAF